MRIFSTLLPIMLGLLLSAPVMATSVLPASLQHLSSSAELIFHGRAIANEVKIDELSGRVATYTSFEVIEIIKGNAASTHTIKQLGGQLPGSNRIQKIYGVPSFTIGETYVVFMPKTSELGFSSPLGLSQGRFTVRESNGTRSVSNGRAIDALIPTRSKSSGTPVSTSLQSLPHDAASTSLVEFLQTVRELAAE